MTLGLEQFSQAVVDTGLLTATDLETIRASLNEDQQTTRGLAQELVRLKRLTRFQARVINSGNASLLVLGGYVILDKIGAGGMGQVYKAEHRRMRRQVALKVLPPDAMGSPQTVRRFQREVEAAAKLNHPNIVSSFDAAEENGVHYLVMEYVQGHDLVPQPGDLPARVSRVADQIRQAALGLAYAHAHGVVHRDIKPANLLQDTSGVVKILDMGMARFDDTADFDRTAAAGLTQTGQIMGTVDYMAPEQAEDARQADARSDVYSLGCTLCCLLTTRPPYQGDTAMKILLAHREQPIPDLRKKRPDVPNGLQFVFQKMIAKKAADRFQSMPEVAAALLPFCGKKPEPESEPTPDAGPVYDDDFEFRLADDEELSHGEADRPSTTIQSPSTIQVEAPPVEITCRCGQRFAAAPHLAGKTVPCLSCQAPLKIPASSFIERSIEVTCRCGRRFAARPDLAGKSLDCPGCGDSLTIPKPKMIETRCKCGQRFAAPARYAGRQFKCTRCGASMKLKPSDSR